MRQELRVEGMHCRSCEFLLEEILAEADVIAKASHEKGLVKLEFDETKISVDDIKKMIIDEGYKVI